jgi:gamma-glutamylcyclotransferase (GGCT)/AIG2-like uncharacterized protein YtfP
MDKATSNGVWKVFVYGTLKSGYHNHMRYCTGVARVEAAEICGRLYDTGFGFPALQLPTGAILGEGSTNYQRDHELRYKAALNHKPWKPLECASFEGWDKVYGEILTFRFPAHQLKGIDRLEDFNPGKRSLYRRVLALARCNGATEPVWVYVMDEVRGRRIIEGVWN